jgi:hypothetical protein
MRPAVLVTRESVETAIETLLRRGTRPTLVSIRSAIGGGSLESIHKFRKEIVRSPIPGTTVTDVSWDRVVKACEDIYYETVQDIARQIKSSNEQVAIDLEEACSENSRLSQLIENVEGENQRLSETVINLQSQVLGLQDASKKSDAVNESLQQKLATATEEIGKFSLKDELYAKATLEAIGLRERVAQVEGELKAIKNADKSSPSVDTDVNSEHNNLKRSSKRTKIDK